MRLRTDPDVLYEYFNLGALADSYGLRLSASRKHIVLRDGKTQQVVAQDESIAEVHRQLQQMIDANGFERS